MTCGKATNQTERPVLKCMHIRMVSQHPLLPMNVFEEQEEEDEHMKKRGRGGGGGGGGVGGGGGSVAKFCSSQ
jgi:uncharacterized membrane protein YgcG